MTRKRKKQKPIPKKGKSFPIWILPALGIPVVFLAVALVVQPGLVDDAYILLRYSANFAQGHGLVYNPGERVEGYTTFLWTFVIGLLGFLKIPPARSALVLGTLFGLATPYLLAWKPVFGHRGRWWGPLIMVMSPCFVFWSMSGMGTPLATFLLAVSALLFIRDMARLKGDVEPEKTIAPPMLLPALFLALAGMTRMESILTIVPTFITIFLTFRRDRKKIFKYIGVYSIAFAVPFSIWFLWRWNYYGWLFPNTYYNKVSGGGLFLMLRGLSYLGQSVLATGGLPIVALLSLILGTDWRERYLGACANVVFLSVIRLGGDHFALYRFIIPSLPFLALLLPIWAERLFGRKHFVILPAYLVISLGLSLFLFQGHKNARMIVQATHGWEKTGKWFADNAEPTDSIATQAIGAIGYYSDLYIIDVLGLVDEHIAHLPIEVGRGYPGHEKHDAEYVISKSPTYVILGPSGMIRYQREEKEVVETLFMGGDFLKGEQNIIRDKNFQNRYEFVSLPIGDGTYLECYMKKGLYQSRGRFE